MTRVLVALAGLLAGAAFAVPTAGAKGEFWARICGESGCKVIKDRLVGAALTGEAEQHGSKVRTSPGVPAYTVTYTVPKSGKPTGPKYWLTTDRIEFTIHSSQRSVSDLFIRATAGVRPFAAARGHRATPWGRFVALGGAGAGIVLVALLRSRRRAATRRARVLGDPLSSLFRDEDLDGRPGSAPVGSARPEIFRGGA
jgi:hypothetical protein